MDQVISLLVPLPQILTGNVTGSASINVLKAGDSMTGTLNMLTQNEVRF